MDEHKILSVETTPAYLSDSSPIAKISPAKMDAISKKCLARLNALKADRQNSNYESDKVSDFNAYHLVPPNTPLPYEGYPNLACPLPRIGVDTFHANVLFTFAGQEGRFNVLPDYLSKSHMDIADRTAQYMEYVLNYESDAYDALDKADLDCNKYKSGYMKAVYVTEKEWVTEEVTKEETQQSIDPITGEVIDKTVKRKKKARTLKTTFDGIKVRRISPESIFVSPFFETIKEAVKQDFLFEVGRFNFRYINEMSKSADEDCPAFFDPKAVKKLKDWKTSQLVSQFEQAKEDYTGDKVERAIELMPIELAEAHFHEDMNDDDLAEKITVIFETQSGIILRVSWAKCRIVKLNPRPIDGRGEGESIRQAIQSLVLEWEAIHNQRVAKGQWANLPFFFYKAGGRFNPQILTLSPGKGYPVDDAAGVNFPQMPSVDLSYFNEEKLIMDLIDRVLALGDTIQGVTGGGDPSATATIHAQQRAGIRLSNPINRIGNALQELMGHIWELNKECAPPTKEFKVAGMGDGSPIFKTISSKDYDTLVSFKLKMATMYDVQMLRDSAMLTYKILIANPLYQQDPAALYQLTMDTQKALGVNIKLIKPDQAKVKSPWLVFDLIRSGKDNVEPVLGTDPDEHMEAAEAFMADDEFENWPDDRKMQLKLYYDKLQILKQTLQSGNLNQAGMPMLPPQMAGPMPPQPGMTATRNPSQTFNNMRIGETGKSQQTNLGNGIKGY